MRCCSASVNSTEKRLRARFKVAYNGVGRYQTHALVPKELQGPVHTFEPEHRIEGNVLYIKLF